MKIWLTKNVFNNAVKRSQRVEYAYTYFRENKIEPFTSKELEKHVNSAYIVGERKEIIVVLAWTSFAQDDQSTLSLNLLTHHGRATPLLWRTVEKTCLNIIAHVMKTQYYQKLSLTQWYKGAILPKVKPDPNGIN